MCIYIKCLVWYICSIIKWFFFYQMILPYEFMLVVLQVRLLQPVVLLLYCMLSMWIYYYLLLNVKLRMNFAIVCYSFNVAWYKNLGLEEGMLV